MKRIRNYSTLIFLLYLLTGSRMAHAQTCTAVSYSVGANGNVFFTAVTSPTNATAVYNWNFGNNTTGSGSNAMATYTTNGSYVVVLSFSTSVPFATCTVPTTVIVNSVCSMSVNYTMPNPINACNGTATVSGVGFCTPPGFIWSNLTTGAVTGGLCKGTTYSVTSTNNGPNCCPSMSATFAIPNTTCGLTSQFTVGTVTQTSGAVGFTATSTGTNASVGYTWIWGDGTFPNGSGATPVHSYSIPGIFSPTLVTTNVVSPCVDAITKTLTVPCSINPSFSIVGPNASSVTLNNTSQGTHGGTSYTWKFGDGSPNSVSQNTNHVYTSSGSYSITLVVNNNFSVTCKDSITQNVTVNVAIPCAISTTIIPQTGAGGVVNFSSQSTGTNISTSYLWKFANGITSTTPSPVYTYTANGLWTVTLTVTNSPTCSVVAQKALTITSVPVPCTLSASFAHTVGTGGGVTFLSTSSGVGNSTTYKWNFGDGVYAFGNLTNHTYQYNGAYNVKLVIKDTLGNCAADSVIYSVNVTGMSCIAVSAFNLSPSGVPQYWNATPIYPWNVSYATWDWGDGSSSNTLYSSHSYSAAGTYSICLTVTVSCGSSAATCTSAAIYRLQNGSEGQAMVYINVLKPELSNSLPAYENNGFDFIVFPNPGNGLFNLNVTGPGNRKFSIGIYDLVGKLIYEENAENANGSFVKDINLDQTPEGIYFIRVSSDNQVAVKKLIISKQ
ncbi:MAG: PKD domain-containing protein [Bacteroidota bacterium]